MTLPRPTTTTEEYLAAIVERLDQLLRAGGADAPQPPRHRPQHADDPDVKLLREKQKRKKP